MREIKTPPLLGAELDPSSNENFDNLQLMYCYTSGNYDNITSNSVNSVNSVNSDSEGPVWVLRQDVKLPRRQRSSEDRRGVVFDEQPKWMDSVSDELDGPSNNLSAHSLPLPQNLHPEPASSPSYDRVSCLMISDLGNKSSSAPVLKKSNHSSEQLSSLASKVSAISVEWFEGCRE